MKALANPVVLRMALLLFCSLLALAVAFFASRRLRKSLTQEPDLSAAPLPADGLPVHAYHAVIQQLKQQKHELTTQQQAERRKAKASDTLSSTVLANLPTGVLFFNTVGLVRQANAAARKILGFASPVGLGVNEMFRNATLRASNAGMPPSESSVAQALAPAMAGTNAVRGLLLNYITREGETRVLEIAASPVMGEDASLLGTTLVLSDKTDLERIRHEQRVREEISADMAQGLRDSLTTIAGHAQQLACNRDPELARQLADSIAKEAAQLDRTIGSFLEGAQAATAGS
jgi:PAS domain-containing protein